jgi:hypothetical protein
LTAKSSVNALEFLDDEFFAGTFLGIFRSTDQGATWTALNEGLGDTLVVGLAAAGADMFAATSHGVYRWTRGGTGWSAAQGGLPSGTVRCLKSIGPYVFAGTDTGGVWLTRDRGATWMDVSEGIPDARDRGFARLSVFALADDGVYLYLSMPGTGVWRRPLSEMIPVALRPPFPHRQRGVAKFEREFPVPLYRADALPGSPPLWFDPAGRLRAPFFVP